MDTSHEEVNDLVANAYFRRWVRQPDKETNAFWEQWLADHPDQEEAVGQARRIVAFLNFQTTEAFPAEQQEVKVRVMQRIRRQHHPMPQTHFPTRYLTAAAVVGLLLIGGYFFAQWLAQSAFSATYSTDFGEQRELILPDSTRVILNANSQLTFKKNWSAHHVREVWLNGEAFFEVVKKPDEIDGRFIVHTQQLDVEALGTSFNVQIRDQQARVVLNTGKVMIHPAHAAPGEADLILEPGDMATLYHDQLVKTQVNPQHYSSWQDNRLVFNNESIRTIAQRLKHTYGHEIVVENTEWLDFTFTGSCPADDITILLTALAESFDWEVTQKNKKIMLQQRRSP